MPKKNIWSSDYKPYGTYEGEKGNPRDWAKAFGFAWHGTTEEAQETIGKETPWSVLGIPEGSDLQTIKKAFRKLMKIHHPDVGGDPEVCKKIMASYYLLTGK